MDTRRQYSKSLYSRSLYSRRAFWKYASAGFAIGLFSAANVPRAFAHKQRLSLTLIEWDDVQKTLDVTHSFHIHEAENALYDTGVLRYPDLTSLKSQLRLALYVDENFTLALNGKKKLALEIIGAEIDGQSAYVYQQIPLKKKPPQLIITCQIFHNIYTDQRNNVDVTLGETVQSLQFKRHDGPKRITI